MIRRFINQDDNSNKFWNITVEGKIYTVTFGKVDTKGRELTKEFDTETECTAEANKLIGQKTKSGYVELADSEAIPEKIELSEHEAAELFFWEAIKKSNKYRNANWIEYDADEHIEILTELLSKSSKRRLILFEKCLQEQLDELYTAEIAELYIILDNEFKSENGKVIFEDYISDDGFIYFRCWLLLKGKEFVNGLKSDIQTFLNPDVDFYINDCWAEGLLYVSDEAYSVNHDNEDDAEIRDGVADLFPYVVHYDGMERLMNRAPRSGMELHPMYPELVEEIVKIRSQI